MEGTNWSKAVNSHVQFASFEISKVVPMLIDVSTRPELFTGTLNHKPNKLHFVELCCTRETTKTIFQVICLFDYHCLAVLPVKSE